MLGYGILTSLHSISNSTLTSQHLLLNSMVASAVGRMRRPVLTSNNIQVLSWENCMENCELRQAGKPS